MSENDEQPSEADKEAFLKMINSSEFSGFCGCGHEHADEEGPGILWNDAGHRLQIEQAIRVLTAVEPGSGFLTLWSQHEFRDGFYEGLWHADYRSPYSHPIKFGGPALYTGHFYDPDNGHNLIDSSFWLELIRSTIVSHAASAKSWFLLGCADSQRHLREWVVRGEATDLRQAGFNLGIAAHFLTDLTQPMHAANFANRLGFSGEPLFDQNDNRHSHFENCADRIINDPASPLRPGLFCDPSRAEVAFENSLETIIMGTANYAKSVFTNKVKDLMLRTARNATRIEEADAIDSFRASFPQGQINAARFLQQWARPGFDRTWPLSHRSDWVAVSMRKDSRGGMHPCIFYRRDGDLRLIFRYLDGGQWHEDAVTFAKFEADEKQTSPAAAFAACYDESTGHPALFIADANGQLSCFDAPAGGWRQIAIPGATVRGALVAECDRRTGKPNAFFRDPQGRLCHVHWHDEQFKVHYFSDCPGVSGAISAIWDPADCGIGRARDHIGHVAVSYIGDRDGLAHHLHVRNGGWARPLIIPVPASAPDTHPDAVTLASVYDAEKDSVGIFWGQVAYTLEAVKEDSKLKVRVRKPVDIVYSLVTDHAAEPVTVYRGKRGATGRIAATALPQLAVHFITMGPGFAPMLTAERIGGTWVKRLADNMREPAYMVAAAEARDGSPCAIGFRAAVAGNMPQRVSAGRLARPELILFKTGEVVILRSANGKLLQCVTRGQQYIDATASEPTGSTQFLVEVMPNGKIALKADRGHGGVRYLSWVNHGALDLIQPAKATPDEFSQFDYVYDSNGRVALVAANGSYWKQSSQSPHFQIEANGDLLHPTCWFSISH